MFERDLQARLSRIFGMKTTLNAPSYDAPEQDTLFVTIREVSSRAGGNRTMVYSRVTGTLTVFAQNMLSPDSKGVRLPFSYFARRVAKADPQDVSQFFFEPERDISNSPARVQNLHERQVNFTFFHNAQFDPDRGELSSVNYPSEES